MDERALAMDEIQTALGRLGSGIDRYLWLQRNLGLCNVSTSAQFQTRFNGFYRVRRGLPWRSGYFDLMESAKATGIGFPDALQEINRRTGRIEASFASKLAATLDPSKPVVDNVVPLERRCVPSSMAGFLAPASANSRRLTSCSGRSGASDARLLAPLSPSDGSYEACPTTPTSGLLALA
jgi:hypothetical protein